MCILAVTNVRLLRYEFFLLLGHLQLPFLFLIITGLHPTPYLCPVSTHGSSEPSMEYAGCFCSLWFYCFPKLNLWKLPVSFSRKLLCYVFVFKVWSSCFTCHFNCFLTVNFLSAPHNILRTTCDSSITT